MIFFPHAKINLGLEVLKKRVDGYHDIQSCLVEIPISDVLEILPANDFSFSCEGLSVNSSFEENLCVKAFRLMQRKYDLANVELILLKTLPMGAGLGGGSSDAAAVITGLNDYFNLELAIHEMEALAAELGSDCPFFIRGGRQIATGRGEVLSGCDVDLKGVWLKVINPGIHISTQEAYAGVQLNLKASDFPSILKDQKRWKKELVNSFEGHIFQKHPELEKLKMERYEEGAFYAAMSGSGSTIFGLYYDKPDSQQDELFERIVQFTS